MSDLDPTERVSALRILDANANRATEGLRVIEDYSRFALDDRHLAEQAKSLRHQLAEVLRAVIGLAAVTGRDTGHDVGRTIVGPGEQTRGSLADVAVASGKRCEQALRCLEEYSKPYQPEVAPRFEALRYLVYTLNQAVAIERDSRDQIGARRLCVLIHGGSSSDEFMSLVRELVDAGADALQLRDKNLGDRELLERAQVARRITKGTATMLFVNDRPDIARLADADGVHVGQVDLRVAQVRRIVGPRKLIGVSTHSIEDARNAVRDGANYLGCGPVFPSATKRFTRFPGPEFLRQVAAEIGIPLFAIGGISAANLPIVLETGIDRVAVGNAVMSASSPGEAVRQLRALLVKHAPPE